MSRPTGSARSDGERAESVQRLKSALAERKDARKGREAATGGDKEIEATVAVRAADEQVDARQRWLAAVDQHNEA
jgi:hypothetical protein